ncbi:LGFP repeat-containing protein [Candidatus Blastococcus massiliensis]|uniref:LGFP repeat-containing protein n=1 Tax=Candidatus Blastococcus massiliensis TaxID=1470358 RepID=UPI000685CADF|nr:hypothetical protein [Candidatus Blastococcus massiliensis]
MRTMVRLLAVLTVAAASLLSPVTTSTPVQQAEAADLRLFDPGNIISDAVFFDGLAMDAAAIQAFLGSKAPSTCPNPALDSSPCLRDYRMNTTNRAADNLCAGYQGAANESAAVVIAKVSVSCRVNPRVLLVLLQKEMGFITSSNPTDKMYVRAAGYGCPDNGTGTCDPSYEGLQNQLYRSAWQYQRYAASPASYSYRAGRTNIIGYYPAVQDRYGDNRNNVRCGTSQVYIQNQATAGLYNYTPYRPNQAALNASNGGYGTGDSCSSYGNRNFWNYFTDWFGSTHSAGAGAIMIRHNELGGAGGRLGAATTGFHCGLRDNGCFQHYTHGSIYWSPATGARAVESHVRAKWASDGWELGPLGYPTSELNCGLVRSGCFQEFQRGSMYSSPGSGTLWVRGIIRAHWASMGWELGWLGYPTTDELCGTRGGGCVSHFQNGSIWFHPSTGAHAINSTLMGKWRQLGYEAGAVGYPTSGVTCELKGHGCFANFQGGSLYYSPATGTQFVKGAIGGLWRATGAENGWLGYPTTDELCALRGGGCVSHFQNGSIWYSPATGVHVINRTLMGKWHQLGYESGAVGYPTSSVVCELTAHGCAANFQGGSLYYSPATGTQFVKGAIRDLWTVAGRETGWMGYPTSDETCGLRGGGCFSHFQGASIYYSPASGVNHVSGPIKDAWAASGWEAGGWGYPTGNPASSGSNVTQRFQGGTATWHTATGTVSFG